MNRYERNFLANYFYYDETSPSGLRWKVSIKLRYKEGDIAGKLDSGYWKVRLLGTSYRVHRVVWALLKGNPDKGLVIDHIDGNPSNNHITNIRPVSRSVNAQNKSRNKNNSTETTGVIYSEGFTKNGTFYSKYTASIYLKSKKSNKSFSIQKYGNELAFQLAKNWRLDKIDEYNREGKTSYTERHGK